MLYQLHHQNKKNLNEHEMVAQAELRTDKEKRYFVEDVKKSHPLPEGYKWLMCNEKSEHFTWAVKKL